jgi:hypothetical protein
MNDRLNSKEKGEKDLCEQIEESSQGFHHPTPKRLNAFCIFKKKTSSLSLKHQRTEIKTEI